ncbi:MAG: UDP-N-acetylglucosamine 4,6-dehydratase (inverting) [Candidatus Omnitrophica bacterium]|nr:UDP-N-acetylglucosamine 4,6-dehydratase (inverting) [Candidatus Omnitrophota bacterium]
MKDIFSNKVVLITGGTGSFGKKCVEMLLERHKPAVIRIMSRDELKQWEMEKLFNSDPRLRFFIGDIRDKDRLERAMDGAHIVIHAAALKHVPICEYNPFEAIRTNIIGAQNLIDAAIDHNIEKVLAISTDKAVNPVNLYGASKMCMERLFVAGNTYVGGTRQTRFSCVRYGNVVGSRGSIAPLFKKQRETGTITITDERMTRFWITLEQAVEFVINCTEKMSGGEVFVPKIPSMKVTEFAKAIAPDCEVKYTGIRPGEKINECLLTDDEARHTLELDDFFVVEPEFHWWTNDEHWKNGKKLPDGFRYSSETNDAWLSDEDMKGILKKL